MNQFEIELNKLSELRKNHSNTQISISEIETEIQNKIQSKESIATSQMLEGKKVDLTKIENEINTLETKLKSLKSQFDYELKAIEIQGKIILPQVDKEFRTERLVAMNQELKTLIESFDTKKVNEVTSSIKQIYDLIESVQRDCSFDGYVFDGHSPIAELRFLDNYKPLTITDLKVGEFFDFINKHLTVSNNLLEELDENCKYYLKSGRTIPTF